jgi:hypothetical protein
MLAASASSSSNCAAKMPLLLPPLLLLLLLLADASGASLLRGLLRELLCARPAVGDSGGCWCVRTSELRLLRRHTPGPVGELGCCCCCCCWRRRWASSAAAAAGDAGDLLRGLCGWL